MEEEFDEDDFSDLYADVEVQASSAISAMQQSTKLPPQSGGNAARGAEIGGGHRKFDKRDAAFELAKEKNGDGGGGASRNLPVQNYDRCESRIRSEMNTDGGGEGKIDEVSENERYDDHESDEEIGEISGKEKSVNGGDYGSQRKILKHSWNSKKKRVDEMPETCKKENADAREPFSNRACADNQHNYDRKHGGPEITSERHTQACYSVPMDLDKNGSVQISDSVEDSPRGVSECDSEGMSGTSDDTNRRRASCINNKSSSKVELESSESGRNRYGRGDSCSPSREDLSSRYLAKITKRSRYSPSSLRCELQEPIRNRPRKDSESHATKRGTKDGRYHKRWRDGMQEHSNQPKKSYNVPYFKNQPDKDASYAVDTKNSCNRHADRGKLREMVMFSYYENDIPYFGQSKRISTYSGRLPDHGLGPAFLEDQYWDIPNCRPDGHNMSRRRNFLHYKSSEMDYEEMLEHKRYHNQRRYPFQDDIEGLRNLAPKYSSALSQSVAQFMYKGDGVHRRRRTRQDCLSPFYGYDDKFVEGKYRSSAEGRDRLDRCRDRNVACDERQVESSARDKRRRQSSLNNSENLRYIETQVDRRSKHQSFPFCSSEEPYAYSPRDYIGAPAEKYGAGPGNIRCSWKEMHFECDQYHTDVTTSIGREKSRYHPYHDYHIRRREYQQSPTTYLMRERIKGDQCHDHLVGRRHRHHYEVLHSREDAFGSRMQEDIVPGSDEPSYHHKRISKNYEADDSLAFCGVTELNERETGRHSLKLLREEDKHKHFDGYRKSTQLRSHVQMNPSHQDSVDRLVVVGRKCTLQSSIRRATEAGDHTFYGRHDPIEQNEKETNGFEDSDASNPKKTVPTDEGNQKSEFGDIEEGQIITEEMEKATKCLQKTAPDGKGIAQRLDDEKIRQIMMKMERRRERFEEPITINQDCEKTSCLLPESNVEAAAEARLERPARKRRWLGT